MTCHSVGNFIIPTDFHIFQRGRYTTNQTMIIFQGLGLSVGLRWLRRPQTPHHAHGSVASVTLAILGRQQRGRKTFGKTRPKTKERQGRRIFQRGWRGQHLGHILDTSWTPKKNKKTQIFSQDTPSRWRRTRTAAPGVVEVASGSSRVPADKSEAPHRGEGSLEQRTKRNISKHVIFYYNYGPVPVISTYNPIYRMYNHV